MTETCGARATGAGAHGGGFQSRAMLNKICLKDGIPSLTSAGTEQAGILRKIGAKHVVDSSSPTSWTISPARWWNRRDAGLRRASARASRPGSHLMEHRGQQERQVYSATDRAGTSRSISMAVSIRVRSN